MADVQQMVDHGPALVAALVMAVLLLPSNVSFHDAVIVAGAAGRLNAVDHDFDWSDRYNLWSGLIGGMFLALAYFGTDQRQVQRYLTASRSRRAGWACCSTRWRRSRCSSSSCSSGPWCSCFTSSRSRRSSSSRMSWRGLGAGRKAYLVVDRNTRRARSATRGRGRSARGGATRRRGRGGEGPCRLPRGAEGIRGGAARRRQAGGEAGRRRQFNDTNYISCPLSPTICRRASWAW